MLSGQRYQVAYCELADGSAMNADIGAWQTIVYHGLGQLPYKKQHPLVKLALSMTPVVYSLQLPFHGWDATHIPADAVLSPQLQQQMVDTLGPLIHGKRTIILTYSGAGVWVLKSLMRLLQCGPELLYCAFVGAGLSMTEQGYQNSVAYYHQPTMLTALEHFHHSDPVQTIIPLLVKCNNQQGQMFMSEAEMTTLFQQLGKNLLFVCGAEDQVYEPMSTVVPFLQKHDLLSALHMINRCDHYSFFNKQNTHQTIEAIHDRVVQWMRQAMVDTPAPVVVQPTIDVQQLLGTWRLVSFDAIKVVDFPTTSPKIIYPAGVRISGQIIYSADGYMSVLITPEGRASFNHENPMLATALELAAAGAGVAAYSGKYNLVGHQMTHTIIQSFFPNWVGQQQQRFVKFEGDSLILATEPFGFPDGALRQGRLIWKRMENASKLDAAQLPSAL